MVRTAHNVKGIPSWTGTPRTQSTITRVLLGQVATARCYHCHKLKTPDLVLGEMETQKLEMERLRKVTGMEN